MKSIFSSATSAISQAGEQTKRAAENARRASLHNLNATKNLALSSAGFMTEEERIKKHLAHKTILSGIVWKRRGGVSGKLASYKSAWELRPMELRGTAILYYNSDENHTITMPSNDPLTAKAQQVRGYIDLAEEKATVQATFGHSGAPSPFCISIKTTLVANTAETKWKLCFDSHQAQMDWLAAISDVVIQLSVNDYNISLIESAKASSPRAGLDMLRPPPVYEPKAEGGDNPTEKRQPSFSPEGGNLAPVHRLWMRQDYTLTCRDVDIPKESNPIVDNALSVMEQLLKQKQTRLISCEKELASFQSQIKTLQLKSAEKDLQIQELEESQTRDAKVQQQVVILLHQTIKEKDQEIKWLQEEQTEAEHLFEKQQAEQAGQAELQKSLAQKVSQLSQVQEEYQTYKSNMEEKIQKLLAMQDQLSDSSRQQEDSLKQVELDFQQQLFQQQEKVVTMEQEHRKELARVQQEYEQKMAKQKVETAASLEAIRTQIQQKANDNNDTNNNNSEEDDEFEDCVDTLNSSTSFS